jgi:hypothetical protein
MLLAPIQSGFKPRFEKYLKKIEARTPAFLAHPPIHICPIKRTEDYSLSVINS